MHLGQRAHIHDHHQEMYVVPITRRLHALPVCWTIQQFRSGHAATALGWSCRHDDSLSSSSPDDTIPEYHSSAVRSAYLSVFGHRPLIGVLLVTLFAYQAADCSCQRSFPFTDALHSGYGWLQKRRRREARATARAPHQDETILLETDDGE